MGEGVHLWLNNQLPANHVHTAGKGEFSHLLRRELNGRRLKCGKVAGDAEVAEDHTVAATGRLIPVEVEADRTPLLHNNHIRCVAALDDYSDLLHAARSWSGHRSF